MLIASHISGPLLTALRAHPCKPVVVDLTGTPGWRLPSGCEMLITTPAAWAGAPAHAPRDWTRDLRLIQLESVGVDFYPDWIFDRSAVASAKGSNAPSIAEYVLAAMLAREKPFEKLAIERAEDWRHRSSGSLDGKTLGIAGYGSIGRAVARLGKATGMRVIVHRNSAWDPSQEGVEAAKNLSELFRHSDHLVVAMPATEQTRGCIDCAVLALAKPGLHLINVARGTLVQQEHLVQALNDGALGHATLDVTDPEPLPSNHILYTHPRVTLTPHIAWDGAGNADRFRAIVIKNFEALVSGAPFTNLIEPRRGY